jgi:O-antigen/teichoic acid export membrane protein
LISLLDLGLQQSLIARVASADDRDESRRRLTAGVLVLLGMGVLAAAVVAVFAEPLVDLFAVPSNLHADAVVAVRLLALQLALDLPATGLGSGLEGLRRYELDKGLDATRITIFVGLAIAISVRGGGIVALAAASLATTLVYVVVLATCVVRAGLAPKAGGRPREEVHHGVLVLGIVVTTVAVAGFDVADKLNLLPLTILGIATSALIPHAAAHHRTNPARTTDLARRTTEWTSLLTLPLAAFVFGAAAPLTRLVARRRHRLETRAVATGRARRQRRGDDRARERVRTRRFGGRDCDRDGRRRAVRDRRVRTDVRAAAG